MVSGKLPPGKQPPENCAAINRLPEMSPLRLLSARKLPPENCLPTKTAPKKLSPPGKPPHDSYHPKNSP